MATPEGTITITEVGRRLGISPLTVKKAAQNKRCTTGYFDPDATVIDNMGRMFIKVGAVWRSRRPHGGVYRITEKGLEVMVRSKLYKDGALMRQYIDEVEASKVVAEDEARRAERKAASK